MVVNLGKPQVLVVQIAKLRGDIVQAEPVALETLQQLL